MNLASLESWIILQIALEAILVVLVVVFLIKVRRLSTKGLSVPPDVQGAMERFLVESEKLSVNFTKTLHHKKEISVNLLLQLERKINDMNRLLEKAEANLSEAERSAKPFIDPGKANPAAPENRALVIRLADQGLSVEEIARKAHLHRGEVELILDLEKQFNL